MAYAQALPRIALLYSSLNSVLISCVINARLSVSELVCGKL